MKYFSLIEQTPLYYAAIALHPGCKLEWFEAIWGKYNNGKWVKDVKSMIKKLFNEYTARAETPPSPIQQIEQPVTEPDIDPYDAFNTIRPRKKAKKDVISEWDLYFDNWNDDDQNMLDVLGWWADHKAKYPILYTMAMDILSIPGMSAEVERVFSAGGRLITDERNSLGPEAVKACQLQKHWMKEGVVFANEH